MKMRYLSLFRVPVLIAGLLLILSLPVSGKAYPILQSSEDALIRQVLTKTAQDLGWSTSIMYEVSDEGIPEWLIYNAVNGNLFNTNLVQISEYQSADAANTAFQSFIAGEPGSLTDYQGHTAFYSTDPDTTSKSLLVQIDQFLFLSASVAGDKVQERLEVCYNNGVALGLISGEVTLSPDQEQVGIQITAEGFETKDFIFTSVDPISEILIEGIVVDAQGNAIAGATISLMESSFVEKSSEDGYFQISAYVKDEGKPFGISQNFPLVSKIEFTAEILEKDKNGNSYKGIVADGASSLILKVHIPADADPNKITIHCSILVNHVSQGLFPVCSTPVVEGNSLLILVEPLEQFSSPYDIRVDLEHHRDDGSSKFHTEISKIKVIHPPVVLIHGIWSSRAAMNPMRIFLHNTGSFSYLVLADYSATSYSDIRSNVSALRAAVDRAFDLLETNGYYGRKVDIVAHSMGGLISRLYMLGYTAPDGSAVLGQGQNIRKLITLSTPHLGSPLGDWYAELDPPGMFDCSDSFLGPFGASGNHEPYKDEYEYLLDLIRSLFGLRSDALTYGDGARQLATTNNPLLVALNDKQRAVGNNESEFYFLAGNKAFLSSEWQGNMAASYSPSLIYPYQQEIGPCGQIEMPDSFENMVAEFFSFATAADTDGVVQVNSSLGSSTGIQPVEAKTVPFNHFTITEAGSVWKDVYTYLVGLSPSLKGTYIFKGSPGVLHVYDTQGRHVGPGEIGIPGATYEEFEDVTGQHTLIYVPDEGLFTVNVDVPEAGRVDLEVNQGGTDGWRWTRYEGIEVDPGSQIELMYDRDNPQGQVDHANGETISLAPTHNEIFSVILPETSNENFTWLGTSMFVLLVVGILGLMGIILIVIIFIWAVRRNRSKAQPAVIASGDGRNNEVQDVHGRWWYQDPGTRNWSIWNGNTWQPVNNSPVMSERANVDPKPKRQKSGRASCLFAVLVAFIFGAVVVVGISLVAFNFFPAIQLQAGTGDIRIILAQVGGGLLIAILGLLLIRGGFKAIITRRSVIEDDMGRRREKRGIGAIFYGLGLLFFGVLFLISGIGLLTLVFYQEILPYMGGLQLLSSWFPK